MESGRVGMWRHTKFSPSAGGAALVVRNQGPQPPSAAREGLSGPDLAEATTERSEGACAPDALGIFILLGGLEAPRDTQGGSNGARSDSEVTKRSHLEQVTAPAGETVYLSLLTAAAGQLPLPSPSLSKLRWRHSIA